MSGSLHAGGVIRSGDIPMIGEGSYGCYTWIEKEERMKRAYEYKTISIAIWGLLGLWFLTLLTMLSHIVDHS